MRESTNKSSSILHFSGSPITIHLQTLMQIEWPPTQVNEKVQLQLQPTPVPQATGHNNETNPFKIKASRDEEFKNKNRRPFHCEFCKTDFQYSDLLRIHLNDYHKTDMSKSNC